MSIEKLGQIWPEWSVEKQLGKGSYGVVYKAVRKDHNLESHAAIKVISIPQDQSEIDSLRSEGLDLNGSRTYLQGIVNDFVSEIQLMESLKGIQNIVSVEDYKVVEKTDEIGWDIFIRMELLTPFNTYISDKKLSEADVIKLGIDICTALEICSKRNIIHRDIKPENIFVNDFGYFKLGDFGIARKLENMTGGLSQKGTFNYMAPEVANSSYYDARVDTYSLGIVLYKLLNDNHLPFLDSEKQLLNPNDRRMAVLRRINGEKMSAPCDASTAMSDLILRACAFDPNQRFATASEMKKALEAVANGSYVTVPVKVGATTSVRHAQAASDVTDTFKHVQADLDATDAVRHVQPDLDATDAVRHVSTSSNATQPETFGKKKSKVPKIIAIVAAIVIVTSIAVFVPKLLNKNDNDTSTTVTGNSASGTCGTYAKWQLDGDVLTISGSGEVSSDPWFNDYSDHISKIVIESGITEIPDNVFLANYSQLIEVIIPDSVIYFADNSFAYTRTLQKYTVSNNNQSYTSIEGVLFSKDKTKLVLYPLGKTTKQYTVPYGTESIGKGAFFYGPEIDITLPNTLKRIESCAFDQAKVKRINIPKSVEYIGGAAFLRWDESQTIYIEERSRIPRSWDYDWNEECNATIIMEQ